MSKKERRKKLDYLLLKDPSWKRFKRAEAHRSYLLAMSMYKYLRYGKEK
jgi:hypothetical protein